MKPINILFIILIISTTITTAQERTGVFAGFTYETTSHENPYVFVDGSNAMDPLSVTGFSDNTNHLYFPFGYAAYSDQGYAEFSTYAFHQLFVGALNLLRTNEYKIGVDKTYSGDSWADGYVPVFNDAGEIGNQYDNFTGNKGLEASFIDMDFLRLVYSGSIKSYAGIPLMLGFQGGIGNFGVHFAQVEEGHEPSEINNDYTGLVNFNEAVDLYFGINTGYVTEIFEDDLAMLLIQYDWYYFIKGTGDEMRLEGNKLTVELTYFPFDYRKKFLKNIFFKGFYKSSTVPYMKDFAEKFPTDYSFSKIGLGVNYFIF